MTIDEKISALRKLMTERGIDLYIIPSADAHMSEYVGEHWMSRAWISGFTGSAGTVLITADEALLWADGRYYIQAEKQIAGTCVKLMKMGHPDYPTINEWTASKASDDWKIGFDGKTMSLSFKNGLNDAIKGKKVTYCFDEDLIDLIWEDRPSVPDNLIFIHDKKYTGLSRTEKLDILREKMSTIFADTYIITSLDEIAYLFNLRGSDVPNNPVFTAFAAVTKDSAYLFTSSERLTPELSKILHYDNIKVKSYEDIYSFIEELPSGKKTAADFSKLSVSLYSKLKNLTDWLPVKSPIDMMKSIKNPTEIKYFRETYIEDCAAMVRFIKWLKENAASGTITEISADEKLLQFRKMAKEFHGRSFDTIAGYKENAAMMHYKATPENNAVLKPEGYLLVDSGGQYPGGTTDITRTISLGHLTAEDKRDYTLVLKAMINLSMAKFLHGCTGTNLDILSRNVLWQEGIDYKCGTGHGVGYFLNVHEGPQGIRMQYNDTVLEEGMILTNEPGIYRENIRGIRIENDLVVVKDEKNEFGQFMRFETLSYCPLDMESIEKSMLSPSEIKWINNYNAEMYSRLSPLLNEEENKFLEKITAAI